jgi:hypothetical protein
MTTRDDLLSDLENRLQDVSNTTWLAAELEGYLDAAIGSLYPHWYVYNTDTTTAGAGPIQPLPSGARNLHYVGVKSATATRVRVIRGWQEGDGEAVIPKVNITDQTLVWAWTTAHAKPANGSATLTIPRQAEEVVILRAQVTALERILSARLKSAKYFAQQVREGVTETEIITALDALHASIDARLKDAPGPPERVG